MQFKRVKRPVHGVLLLDKPIGYSSNQALQKVKWLYQAAKAGHTGTLDPLATGALPICFGEATKFSHYLLDANKAYIATLKLGVTTTTGDVEGEVLSTKPVSYTQAQLAEVLKVFEGDIMQTPPMYSALKHEGKALYEYARDGIEIERKARPVNIQSIQILNTQAQEISLHVRCSKGTYIRTLAEDIGNALGCGAHLIGLRRAETAHYDVRDAVTLEALEKMNEAQRDALLKPVDSALQGMPCVNITADAAHYFRQGQAIWVSALAYAQDYKVYQDAQFLGLGSVQENGQLKPKRLIVSV